jgi:hypothetical protein
MADSPRREGTGTEQQGDRDSARPVKQVPCKDDAVLAARQ